jgi:hypothetical protein
MPPLKNIFDTLMQKNITPLLRYFSEKYYEEHNYYLFQFYSDDDADKDYMKKIGNYLSSQSDSA